jgi:hypothetical protein
MGAVEDALVLGPRLPTQAAQRMATVLVAHAAQFTQGGTGHRAEPGHHTHQRIG